MERFALETNPLRPSAQHALEIHSLSKQFDVMPILNDINLTIHEGQFVVIIGPSGCGKSTLLNLVAGFEKPSNGYISIKDKVVSNRSVLVPPHLRNMSMVFQSLALWPHLNVFENVEFPLRYRYPVESKVRNWAKNRITRILQLVGLENCPKMMPYQLSGDQQQRIALARSLVTDPDILLMDEPLSGLDPILKEQMVNDIQRISRQVRNSVLYVTHDLREAMTLADCLVVMNQGRIEQIGDPEEIYMQPKTPFVAQYVSRANLVESTLLGEQVLNKVYGALDPRQIAILRENIHLRDKLASSQSQDRYHMEGRIVSRQFLGTGYEFTIRVNQETNLISFGTERFEVNQEVIAEITSFQSF